MRTKALNLWYSVRSSYWFVPTLMAFLAILLALVMVAIDMNLHPAWAQSIGRIFGNEPAGARLLLATISGSMMTVAGVVFSVTIVTLTLASSQFGPRLLTNFMRDTGNQVVLGTFIATFLYCLLVLLAVGRSTDGPFMPHLSIAVGLASALVSVGVLIFFIHHAAETIQVRSVIVKVSNDLNRVIDRRFPKEAEVHPSLNTQNNITQSFGGDGSPIAATRSGYLQAIDRDNLVKLAAEGDLVVFNQYQPGKFVVQGTALALVWPEEKLDEHLAARIRDRFFLGDDRTYEQDVEFAIDQLVEIGIRAISPAINDPFTAMMCIDRLGAALCQLTTRDFPPSSFVDENGKARLIEKPITFGALLDAALNQLRQYGRSNAAVTIRLLEILTVIAQRAAREEDTLALLRHAGMIRRDGKESLQEELDRQDVEERYQTFLEALQKQPEKAGRAFLDERRRTDDR